MVARMIEKETAESFDLTNDLRRVDSHRSVRNLQIVARIVAKRDFRPLDLAANPLKYLATEESPQSQSGIRTATTPARSQPR
jgi:hypothetical protein